MLWPWFCRREWGRWKVSSLAKAVRILWLSQEVIPAFPYLCAGHPWLSSKLWLLKFLYLTISMLSYNLFSSPHLSCLALSPHLLRLRVTILVFARNSIILETAQNTFQVIALFSCTIYTGWKGGGKSSLASLCQWVGGVVSPLCRCHTGAPPDFC